MLNDLETVTNDVDDVISAGFSYVIDEPNIISDFIKNESCLTVISQNIRSVNKNIIDFKVTLNRSNLDFDLIVLSECWLKGCDAIPELDGYSTYYTKEHINQNSGVIAYVRTNLSNVSVHEPSLLEADCLVVRIDNTTFICIYRSPSFHSADRFLQSLDNLLNDLKHTTNIIILGDINIDISNNTNDAKADEYLDLLAMHHLIPGHTFPTRLEKCIDHCMVKTKTKVTTAICPTSTTDHSSLFLILPLAQRPKRHDKYVHKIDFNVASKFLSEINWNDCDQINDANQLTEFFIATVTNIIKNSTRVHKAPSRKRILQPWITPGLLRCMRFRDTLSRRHKRTPNDKALELTFKRYRNHCNNILHNLKNCHDKTKLYEAKNDIKQTWNVIKRICYPQNKNLNDPSHLLKLKPSPEDSVNAVNDYFANVGRNLADNILQKLDLTHDKLINDYKPTNTSLNSFVILETDEVEVGNIIGALKTTSSCGWDGIPSTFIKKFSGILGKSITRLCNLCFTTGVFPTMLKESIVVPIFKSGEKHCISNYRPISLLPTLAKIIEKLINVRLVKYLENNKVLASNQYGFRGKRSTIDAVESLVYQITNSLDDRKKCISVFLDLAKAFDTVSVPLLLYKLESIGIRGIPLKLMTDYLSSRSQTVKIGEIYSNKSTIHYGVPQGSVLGPTLFLIYINSLCLTQLDNASIITFADDTVLTFVGKTWEETKLSAESGLRIINSWLDNNLLTLNLSKTKYITFSIYNNKQPNINFTLKAHTCPFNSTVCDCAQLSAVKSIKYLGIIIDKNLNWKSHIDHLKARVRKLIHVFKKLRNLRDDYTNKTVYQTLCQSVISYGITAWGSAVKTNLIKIERAQRSILKVLNFKRYRYPTVELYRETGMLTVRQLYIKTTLLRQHSLPYRTDNRCTRRSHEVFRVPTCKTQFARRSTNILGPFLYNRLSKVTKENLIGKTRFVCSKILHAFLQPLSYEDTEHLLAVAR